MGRDRQEIDQGGFLDRRKGAIGMHEHWATSKFCSSRGWRRSALLLGVVAIAVVAAGCGGGTTTASSSQSTTTTAGHPVVVFGSFPLQGSDASGAGDFLKGAHVALAERGDWAGATPVTLQVHDDTDGIRWNADAVAANAHKAVADPSAVAYLGDYNSGAVAVAMPILNEAGMAQMGGPASVVALTVPDGVDPTAPERYQPTGVHTFARVMPNDRAQGKAIVRYLVDQHVTSIYVVDDGGLYGKGLGTAVSTLAPQSGVTVVAQTSIDPNATQFTTLAGQIAASGAGAMVYAGPTSSHAPELFRDVHAAAPDLLLFGGDGLNHAGFTSTVGNAAGQVRITAPVPPADGGSEVTKAFVSAYKKKYSAAPALFAYLGYDAMNTLLNAIAEAKLTGTDRATNRAAVRAALFDLGPQTGAMGSFSIDQNGDTTLARYGQFVIRDGHLVEMGQG
jgi:branched-chain amino acid transport system substrate-binding protein